MTEYSDGFRARTVERMTGRKTVSANALAQEVGITQPTLSRWLREAATVRDVSKKKSRSKRSQSKGRRPREWFAEDEVRVLLESAALAETELGAFLRRGRLHQDDRARFHDEVRNAAVAGVGIECWRKQVSRGCCSPLTSETKRALLAADANYIAFFEAARLALQRISRSTE